MSPLSEIPIVGSLLEGIGALLKCLSIAKNKLFKFKNDKINEEMKQIVFNGDINAPVYILQQKGDAYFGNLDNEENLEWIKRRLERGKPTKFVETKFSDEFNNYKNFSDTSKYPYPFIETLDFQYRGLIKSSTYIKKLYDEGDRDIATKMKDELSIGYGPEGRQFCNLYTEGYIPDVLEYINQIGLLNKLTIQQVLDYVAKYKGVLFVHTYTNDKEILDKTNTYIKQGLNYIAIHGTGSNTTKVKNLKSEITKMVENTGYFIKEKTTPKGKLSKINRYAIFVYNQAGEKIYRQFLEGTFKGFA